MLRARHTRAVLGVVFVLGICGCVTLPPNSKPAPQDPWESWNRGVYKVNDKLDRAVAQARREDLCARGAGTGAHRASAIFSPI